MAIPSFAAIAYSAAYPAWRHLVFVLVNLGFAGLFLTRPLWLIWPYTILAIQVLHSHGADILKLWRLETRVDWISVATVVVTLGSVVLLVRDRHERRRTRR